MLALLVCVFLCTLVMVAWFERIARGDTRKSILRYRLSSRSGLQIAMEVAVDMGRSDYHYHKNEVK